MTSNYNSLIANTLLRSSEKIGQGITEKNKFCVKKNHRNGAIYLLNSYGISSVQEKNKKCKFIIRINAFFARLLK